MAGREGSNSSGLYALKQRRVQSRFWVEGSDSRRGHFDHGNIAEGFDADSDAEFCRFLGYAKRSATEVQSHGYVALDESYMTQPEFDQLYAKAKDAKSLIGGFVRYLRANPRPRKSSA